MSLRVTILAGLAILYVHYFGGFALAAAYLVWLACLFRQRDASVGARVAAAVLMPLGLTLRDCLVRNVQARRPKDRIAHLLFGTAGEAGGINGMNARGVAVTSARFRAMPGWKRLKVYSNPPAFTTVKPGDLAPKQR